MRVHPKVDVVSVGAGWTAAIMAWKLCNAGLKMVSLEQGPTRWANPDFEMDHDPLRYDRRHLMMVDLGKESWTWRPKPGAPALPMRQYGSFHPGQGVGGSAIHWSGMLWRFLETDFRYRSHYIEKYGADKLPAGNMIQDWPLDYFELRPYYEQFERDIGASGKAGNLNGKKIPGGNPFEAPRLHEYPNPPLASTVPAEMFARAAGNLGYHPFPQPSGILSRAYTDPLGNHRSGCLYCGFCTRYGCEVDAKSSAQTTHPPVALATGNYQIRTGCRVTGIALGANGMATGLTYVDTRGHQHFQPADIVLLTGYTLNNVRMLLLSRGKHHPAGVGNDRGRVGKNMTYQNWQTVGSGIFPGRHFNLFAGNTSTNYQMYDFNADNFDHGNLDFVGGAQIFAGLGELHPISTAPSLPLGTNSFAPLGTSPSGVKTWGSEFKTFLRENAGSIADVLIQGESLPYQDQFYDLDPNYKDAWGQPLLRITFDWHPNDQKLYAFMAEKIKGILQEMGAKQMYVKDTLGPYVYYKYQSTHQTGGAIMGADPSTSVTNKYGQVWDTPNVFVTGAALYPQNPGANPTGTLCPLAYMAADAIRDKYLKDPDRLIGH
jgi:gluconate 2-dehydrogenase alpha chain